MTTEKTPNPVAKALEPFVCGGTAATFASIVIHPIDLAKVRIRIQDFAEKARKCPLHWILD